MWCPERFRRPLKIRARQYNFRGRPYPYPHQVSKVNSLWQLNNVGKGSRQTGSVTSGEGLALRAESNGLESETYRSSLRLAFLPSSLTFGLGLIGRIAGLRPGRSWATSAVPVALSLVCVALCACRGFASFVWRQTANSELARTWGIRLSN